MPLCTAPPFFFTVKRRQKPNTLNPLHSNKAQEQEGILEAHSFLGLGILPKTALGTEPCVLRSLQLQAPKWELE